MGSIHQKLISITESLGGLLPEIIIVLTLLVVLTLGLFKKGEQEWLYRAVSVAGVFIVLYLEYQQWHSLAKQSHINLFDMLRKDRLSVLWSGVIGVGTILSLLMGFKDDSLKAKSSEYYVLVLSMLLGANILVMASNLLMVYLGLEILSLGAYVLTTFAFNQSSAESGIKYLLFGAASSGIMLYGMSLLYTITGTLDFEDARFVEQLMQSDNMVIIIAGILVMAGLLYKISAAPMHVWSPDVYTSAPTPVVALFSVVPKLAGVAIFMKWVMNFNLFGMAPLNWSAVLGLIAAITILVGNFSALWQKNVKRMLAYSSIAHSGFMLLGIAIFSEAAYEAVLYYGMVYLLMNMAIFIIVNDIEYRLGYTLFKEYSGLIKIAPAIVVSVIVLAIALTGLPPTAGFTAKLFLFTALWEKYNIAGESWMLYLLIFGLLNAVISLFFYLKLPFYMIFRSSSEEEKKDKYNFNLQNFLGFILVLAVLIIFFKPEALMSIINNVSFAF